MKSKSCCNGVEVAMSAKMLGHQVEVKKTGMKNT